MTNSEQSPSRTLRRIDVVQLLPPLLTAAPSLHTRTTTMTAGNIPKTHREYRVTGASNSFDSLQLKEGVETKTPKADEVLVRMHAVSLNNRDLQVRTQGPR